MAISQQQRTDLLTLLVGMFDAAPGSDILDELANGIDNGNTIEQYAANLINSSEFTGIYSRALTAEEFASSFVANLIGDTVDAATTAEAEAFVAGRLNAGASRDVVILEALNALSAVAEDDATWGAAAAQLNNKVEVAEYFATQSSFTGLSLAQMQAALNGVTSDDATVTAKKEAIDAGDLEGVGSTGQTFTLTQGLDTLTGTSGNDTFNAYAFNSVSGADTTTLQSVDTINGGEGTDTLNIEVKANGATDDFNGAFQGTISNVEIININNTQANSAAAVDASVFGAAAEQIWQIGAEADVTKLAATTTAGFRDIGAGDLSVTGVDAATSVSVALDDVEDDITSLTLAGAGLVAAAVSGTVVDAGTDGVDAIDLTVTGAKDAAAISVNSEVAVTLSVDNAATSTKDLTSVDASASAGDITYTSAGSAVATIKTGAGDDTVTVITATSNTVGSEVNALVESGAGDDKITVNTSGSGKTTVNAGAGDDYITLTSGLNTSTRIDGGEGTDTVAYAGKTFVAGDYALANAALSNVEVVEFTGTTAAVVDASKFTTVSGFVFAGNAGDKVTEASSATLTTKGNLEAASTGYVADSADADSLTDAYGSDLTVTQTGTGTADLFAANANLTVAAGTAAVTSTVTGDAQTLSVTLTNGANSTTNPTADTLTTATVDVSGGENSALTSVTLSGNGSATVTGGAKLATIDASELGGTLAYGANAGNITGGLDFTGDASVKETITLGSGTDEVTVASTYAKMDVITGFDSVKETNDSKSTTDTLTFAGVTLDGNATGEATKVTLTSDATTLELAFVEAAAASNASAAANGSLVTFQFGGNTYLFQDLMGDTTKATLLDDADLAVQVTGLVDFSDDWSVYSA